MLSLIYDGISIALPPGTKHSVGLLGQTPQDYGVILQLLMIEHLLILEMYNKQAVYIEVGCSVTLSVCIISKTYTTCADPG